MNDDQDVPKTVDDYVRRARDPEHTVEGAEQEALMRFAEAFLHEHKFAHAEGSYERDAYEAAHGLILSVHPDVNVREHGARKQWEFQERLKAHRAERCGPHAT